MPFDNKLLLVSAHNLILSGKDRQSVLEFIGISGGDYEVWKTRASQDMGDESPVIKAIRCATYRRLPSVKKHMYWDPETTRIIPNSKPWTLQYDEDRATALWKQQDQELKITLDADIARLLVDSGFSPMHFKDKFRLNWNWDTNVRDVYNSCKDVDLAKVIIYMKGLEIPAQMGPRFINGDNTDLRCGNLTVAKGKVKCST